MEITERGVRSCINAFPLRDAGPDISMVRRCQMLGFSAPEALRWKHLMRRNFRPPPFVRCRPIGRYNSSVNASSLPRSARSLADRQDRIRAQARDFLRRFDVPTAMTTGPSTCGGPISAARRHPLRRGAGILRQSSARHRRAVDTVTSRSVVRDRMSDYGYGASGAYLSRALAGEPEHRPDQVFGGHDREGYVATSQTSQEPSRNGEYRAPEAHRRGVARRAWAHITVRMTARRSVRASGWLGNGVLQ